MAVLFLHPLPVVGTSKKPGTDHRFFVQDRKITLLDWLHGMPFVIYWQSLPCCTKPRLTLFLKTLLLQLIHYRGLDIQELGPVKAVEPLNEKTPVLYFLNRYNGSPNGIRPVG